MKVNALYTAPVVPNIYVFTLGIVMIPVFDTLRVFGTRIWKGHSPFSADKTHIHHLVTNKGFTHGFAARIICVFHGFILILVYWLKDWKPEVQIFVLICCMGSLVYLFNRIGVLKKYFKPSTTSLATQPQTE
jgi:UDP-N-acetylmuramyl pentapeptide phosphotransferase/UDP-N-acetylglucosamine-1-phosphate transferase